MVPEIEEACKNAKIGKIIGSVKTHNVKIYPEKL